MHKLEPFYGRLLLAKLETEVKSDEDKASWRLSLALSIRPRVAHRMFPDMPKSVGRKHADRDAQIDWLLDAAVDFDTDKLQEEVDDGHSSVAAFLERHRMSPIVPPVPVTAATYGACVNDVIHKPHRLRPLPPAELLLSRSRAVIGPAGH